MDIRADNAVDGHWMSYAELGLARGITKESALKLGPRRKWREQADNHGTIRVYVPSDWIAKADIQCARESGHLHASRTKQPK